MTSPAYALISRSALLHNLQRARRAMPSAKVMPVIKADAYGHGMLRAAQWLADEADALAVAEFHEAISLRCSGIQQRLLVLQGCRNEDEWRQAAELKIDVTLHHASQLDSLSGVPSDLPLSIWLKIDSGMHRLGVRPGEASQVLNALMARPGVQKPVPMLTHLANADDRADEKTLHQLDVFSRLTSDHSGPLSVANSAGILGWPQAAADWCRPGIMLYGANPFTDGCAADWGLKPVMTLKSEIIAVNAVKAGEAIGYGGAWQAPEDMTVAVAAIGYGDGYPRHARMGTPILLREQQVPLVGRVSMDSIFLDVRSLPAVQVGDEVKLWGDGLPVDDVAACAGTIPYELLCSVTSRVRFIETD